MFSSLYTEIFIRILFVRITAPGLQIIFQNLLDMMSGKNKIPSDIYENLSDINFYKCF